MIKSGALSDQRESKGARMHYTVYILRFSNNNLYIGQTHNLPQRLKDHKNKAARSSKFSRDNGDFELIYEEEYSMQLEAMRREKQLKGWTRAKKEALIAENRNLLKQLSKSNKTKKKEKRKNFTCPPLAERTFTT